MSKIIVFTRIPVSNIAHQPEIICLSLGVHVKSHVNNNSIRLGESAD